MPARRAAATAALLALLSLPTAAQPTAQSPPPPADAPDAAPLIELPLALHLAEDVPDAEVEGWLRAVNALYADAGVRFTLAERHALPEAHRTLRNNRARHRLKRFLRPRRIDIFVVDAIHDPWPSAATRRAAARVGREPSGRLGGAHILAPGHRPDRYAIVLRRALPLALAHELGHVLGAPHHRDPRNVMSYGADRCCFDDAQRAQFRRRARALHRRRDVR